MQKPIQDIPLAELIGECLTKARGEQNTRENSLTVTKLQEAIMWHNEHQKALLGAARRSGVGFTQDTRVPKDPLSGIVLTEPVELPTQPPPQTVG